MYSLVSALVKPLGTNSRWRTMGIENVPLNVLFSDFSQVIAILNNAVLTQSVSLDLEGFRADLGSSTLTFNDWLASQGSNSLPTSDSVPTINTRYAYFSDVVRSGYKITPTHPTIAPDSTLPVGDKTHALLTKTDQDYQLVYDHVLANVNGFYHQTDHSPEGLYITDGMKTCLKSGRNEVGLLDFLALGKLSFIPITDDMIYTQRPEQQLKTNCYIKTGLDLSNKTVLLVLGGYLHLPDNRTFFRVGLGAFGIDFGQIPLVERYYESYKVIDLDSLGVETAPTNPDQISLNSLFSDAVLRKYLQLSQTFLVVLDNTDIFTDTIELRQSPLIGVYTAMTKPIYPLLLGRGRHEVYWPRKEADQYSINTNGAWQGHKNFETVVTRDQVSVSSADIISLGYSNSQACFQLIGSDFYLP
jgi:hypothetical protein